MPAATRLEGNVEVTGTLSVSGTYSGNINRTNLILETSVHPIPLQDLRIWNAYQSFLPAAAAADDLGFQTGAFSTFVPVVRSLDLNALGAFLAYGRVLITLPPNYVAGQPIQINAFAGMNTSLASVSAVIDFAAYKSAYFNISGADLVNTVATSINTLSPTDFAFDLITTSLAPGDTIDLRMELSGNSATASGHYAFCGNLELLYGSRG
jgi:hypothetical protein